MKRNFSAIVVLLIFCTLQYGKIATYLYCKWQAEAVQQAKDCGCETHLSSMFGEKEATGGMAMAVVIKEISVEFIVDFLAADQLLLSSSGLISHFAEYDSSLLQCYLSPAFRPPAV